MILSLQLSQIPNAICILRIVLVGPIVFALLDGDFGLALLLIIVAGLSDGLDGYLAKRFDWRSRLGGLLDPVADKLLLMSVFITLAWVQLIPVALAVVVIGRDVIIVSGAIAYEAFVESVQPRPSRVSKLNTGLQLLFIVAAISAEGFAWPPAISILILGASVIVVSLVSGLDYVLCWSRLAMRAGDNA
jgi:cardiolipin synthase